MVKDLYIICKMMKKDNVLPKNGLQVKIYSEKKKGAKCSTETPQSTTRR